MVSRRAGGVGVGDLVRHRAADRPAAEGHVRLDLVRQADAGFEQCAGGMFAAVTEHPVHPVERSRSLGEIAVDGQVEQVARGEEALQPADHGHIGRAALRVQIVEPDHIALGIVVEFFEVEDIRAFALLGPDHDGITLLLLGAHARGAEAECNHPNANSQHSHNRASRWAHDSRMTG